MTLAQKLSMEFGFSLNSSQDIVDFVIKNSDTFVYETATKPSQEPSAAKIDFVNEVVGKCDEAMRAIPGSKLKRREILEDAINQVCKIKSDQYGKPEDSFSLISTFWTIYLKNNKSPKDTINPKDVAMMMILLKVAREMFKHKDDNLSDLAGYAACASELT